MHTSNFYVCLRVSHQHLPAMDFNYKGNLNVFKFLKLAQDNDLLVILRPSPFIDAEWDMVCEIHIVNRG